MPVPWTFSTSRVYLSRASTCITFALLGVGMQPSAVIVTGASGLVGRHLLHELKDDYRIFAIARRSQRECGAPSHPNIAWMRVDIGDRPRLEGAFREIATAGGARFLLHLAAYYDFTGDYHDEYRRTNVEGTRNVLALAERLDLERFVFASSVAACNFPRRDGPVREITPADGVHHYAWSKREGEQMVYDRKHSLRSCIVRLGAVYSDWCEYPPLYVFLGSWTSGTWRARILAGRGTTAIPYIHIRDVVSFFRALLRHDGSLPSGDVLVASTEGCTSHDDLFRLSTEYFHGSPKPPVHLPAWVCRAGLRAGEILGRVLGEPPFERTWMSQYIDRRLEVDNTDTRARIGWEPSPRYRIERRLRFLIEARKSEPVEWTARNLMAMRKVTVHPDLRIYQALLELEDPVVDALAAELQSPAGVGASRRLRAVGRSEFTWFVRLLYRLLLNSVQSGNRMLVLSYFEVTGASRFATGFTGDDLLLLLDRVRDAVVGRLQQQAELKDFQRDLHDRVVVPLEFGKDEIREQYERYLRGASAEEAAASVQDTDRTAREQLEDTIWRMLALRRG